MLINGPTNLEEPLTSNPNNGTEVPIPTLPENNPVPDTLIEFVTNKFPFVILPRTETLVPIVCVPAIESSFFNIILLMSKSGHTFMA